MKVIMPTTHRLRAAWAASHLIAHAVNPVEVVVIVDEEHLKNTNPVAAAGARYVMKPAGLDVYGMYNYGARLADDKVLFVNDDMYFPPAWDADIPDVNGFVTFDVVEPGWVEVNRRNTALSFGDTLETFQQEEFDNYAANASHTSAEGLGWYMPLLIPTKLFFELGAYKTDPPFPNSNDVDFFNRAANEKFIKFDSPIYHFQCLSQR